MNYKRIFVFVLILFFSTILAAFPFGIITGHYARISEPIPSWVVLGQAFTVMAAAIVVFSVLTVKQKEKVLIHVSVVASSSWIISYLPNVMLLGQPASQWAFGGIVIVFTAVMGFGIGAFISRKQKNTATFDCQ